MNGPLCSKSTVGYIHRLKKWPEKSVLSILTSLQIPESLRRKVISNLLTRKPFREMSTKKTGKVNPFKHTRRIFLYRLTQHLQRQEKIGYHYE
ncbi:hypothetical protein CJ20_169 [Escherichia phage CJ20]|nr:hypothetical protein CJ20_169 [Escherichia phage CJ20]